VLAEVVALLTARRFPRSRILSVVRWLTEEQTVTFVWVEASLQREAVAYLHARADKDYSLCDAVSFLLMHEYKITDALTTDAHFRQAGYQAVFEAYA
jgi:predicted nucleic acid-binding protein